MAVLRKLLTRSHQGRVGRVQYAKKNGGSLTWQYSNEHDALYLLLFYPTVLFINTQSRLVTYRDAEGNVHEAFPDFQVETTTGPITVEIKDKGELDDPVEMDRLRRIALANEDPATPFPSPYYLLTSDVIKAQPRLKNIRRVMRFRAFKVTTSHYIELRKAHQIKEIWTLEELANHIPDGMKAVFALALQGRLQFDLFKKLENQSRFTIVADSSQQFDHKEVLPLPLLKRNDHA